MSDFLEQVVAERRADMEGVRTGDGGDAHDGVARENLYARELRSGGLAGREPGADPGDAFTATLRRRQREGWLSVIAEVKRVSPALGVLAADVDPAGQARAYANAGASAISVLTEPRHWGGSLGDLEAVREAAPGTPILCKDVIVSQRQITEARSAGADAVLLIAEALTDGELLRFIELARSLHMGALVEAHEASAFGRGVASGAPVVGVNARDLRHPERIDVGRVHALHSLARPEQIVVAESGIASADDARLLPSRVDAVLIGTALMRATDPAPLIRGIAAIRRRALAEAAPRGEAE